MRAEAIAEALGGRKARGSWFAWCPGHDDRKPSLSIHDADDGKFLVHCHAGCNQARARDSGASVGWAMGGQPRSGG